MIFMHGLGDTAYGWQDVANHLVQNIPGLRVVLPTAKEMPVTINMGMVMPSWYDLKDLRTRSDLTGLDESMDVIRTLIERELAEVPSERCIIAGFSQGTQDILVSRLQHTNN